VSEKGKDRLFIAYANYSLRVDPKYFFKIYDRADWYHPFLLHLKKLRLVIEAIVATASFGGPDNKVRDDDVLRIAQEAVYGYRDGFCETTCPMRDLREKQWGKEPFEGPDRLKCTECDQVDFIRIIMGLIDGNDYDQVDGLLPLLTAGRQFLHDFQGKTKVFPIPEPFTRKPMEFKRPKSHDPHKLGFRNYWNALIGYSLSEFLYADDRNRHRLKLCPYCDEFFTATKLDKEICYSQDCDKARQREQKRPYMRKKRDGDSPEYDERYKTREFPKKKPS
jgi:hypothetical protein